MSPKARVGFADQKSTKRGIIPTSRGAEDTGSLARSTNAAIKVDFSFLRTSMETLLERKESLSGDGLIKTVRNEFLLTPTAAPTSVMTIADLINEVQELVRTHGAAPASDVEGKIREKLIPGDTPLAQISIQLKEAFLYRWTEEVYTRSTADAAWGQPAPDPKKDFEYAFTLKIISNFRPVSFLTLDSISISIWNTKRQGVLDSMQLGSIEDVLKSLDGKK
jgi:hypothetical protein